MSFLVGSIAGTGAIFGAMYGGWKGKQQKSAYEEGVTAAGEIKQQTMQLLGEQKDLAGDTATLGFDKAQSQFRGAQRDVSMGTGIGLSQVQAMGAKAASRSGLATSGTVEQKVADQTGDLMAKYKSDMTKLFETRDFAGRQKDLAMTQADLAYRKGEMSAEEAEAAAIAGLDEGGIIEGAIEGGLSILSDKRLKENIDYIGNSPSGIKVYEFNYLNNDIRYRGVMADDLVYSHPNVINRNKNGYYTVDYSQIDVDFETIKRN